MLSPIQNQDAFHLELFHPCAEHWAQIRQELVELEKSAFDERADDEPFLEKEFTNPTRMIVLLYDGGTMVGYAYAEPDHRSDPQTVAYLESIAVLPSYQGRHLVQIITQTLEEEMRKKNFQYMAMRAQVNNGYADKVARHYGQRIVETSEADSKYGMQRYFKIRL